MFPYCQKPNDPVQNVVLKRINLYEIFLNVSTICIKFKQMNPSLLHGCRIFNALFVFFSNVFSCQNQTGCTLGSSVLRVLCCAKRKKTHPVSLEN